MSYNFFKINKCIKSQFEKTAHFRWKMRTPEPSFTGNWLKLYTWKRIVWQGLLRVHTYLYRWWLVIGTSLSSMSFKISDIPKFYKTGKRNSKLKLVTLQKSTNLRSTCEKEIGDNYKPVCCTSSGNRNFIFQIQNWRNAHRGSLREY